MLKRKIDAFNQDRTDMVESIDSYFLDKYNDVKFSDDISMGKKYMKVYKQMKMYNDADLNPMLYKK